MHHPSTSESSAGISPSREARQNGSMLGLGGFFHTHPYQRSSRCFARPFAPAPRAEPSSPWAHFSSVPRHVPRWGPRGLVDHLNLGGNERLLSEPSTSPALSGGSPLQGGLGAACWGELDEGKFAALSARSGKITAGKEIQPAASPPRRNRELRVLGAHFKNRAWVCSALQAPFVCVSSPASTDASMQPCPALRGAHGEQHPCP